MKLELDGVHEFFCLLSGYDPCDDFVEENVAFIDSDLAVPLSLVGGESVSVGHRRYASFEQDMYPPFQSGVLEVLCDGRQYSSSFSFGMAVRDDRLGMMGTKMANRIGETRKRWSSNSINSRGATGYLLDGRGRKLAGVHRPEDGLYVIAIGSNFGMPELILGSEAGFIFNMEKLRRVAESFVDSAYCGFKQRKGVRLPSDGYHFRCPTHYFEDFDGESWKRI